MERELIICQFECVECKKTWEDTPGPCECPYCGYHYVKWLNYEKLAAEAKEKGYTGFGHQ